MDARMINRMPPRRNERDHARDRGAPGAASGS
jgi:hypothetical protein